MMSLVLSMTHHSPMLGIFAERTQRYFCRDGGLLAYGEHVIGEKRVHDVLRGMPFDEPLAVLQH